MARKQMTPPEIACPLPVVLVGMMGVGKTTIGRRLAPKLGLPFYDADEEIVAASGMSIADFFATHGEAEFRAGEARVIRRLLEGPPIVLATGGGAFMHPETRATILSCALSVWLRAPIEIILDRATRRPTRPLLKQGNPRETLEKLLAERGPVYSEALFHVDSQDAPHSRTVNAILTRIDDHLKSADTSTQEAAE